MDYEQFSPCAGPPTILDLKVIDSPTDFAVERHAENFSLPPSDPCYDLSSSRIEERHERPESISSATQFGDLWEEYDQFDFVGGFAALCWTSEWNDESWNAVYRFDERRFDYGE